MKNCFVVFAAVCLLCGYSYAADTIPGNMSVKSDTVTVKPAEMPHDYVTMNDGVMMVVKSGMKMMMDRDMTMANGTLIMKDGTYKLKDGTTLKMKECDRIDMSGALTNEKSPACAIPAN